MKVFVGQTRSRKLIKRLAEKGFGECTNRGEYPPRRTPWFLDNGAYKDWTAKPRRPFDAERFLLDLAKATAHEPKPDFVVCPDRVASPDSLEFSLRWMDEHASSYSNNYYLAVQDGMQPSDVEPHLDRFGGIFVGGTVEWKVQTGAEWVEFAHAHDLPCHIGRAGGAKRVKWAIRIGADSIDSCLPLWSEENLQRFLGALNSKQMELF